MTLYLWHARLKLQQAVTEAKVVAFLAVGVLLNLTGLIFQACQVRIFPSKVLLPVVLATTVKCLQFP